MMSLERTWLSFRRVGELIFCLSPYEEALSICRTHRHRNRRCRDQVAHTPARCQLAGQSRIHYQEAGDEDAPPVILIHGFISSNLIWSGILLPLARAGFRVIAPDLPGYGYSDKPADAEYTI